MILPLAFILRSKWISHLSIIPLYIYLSYSFIEYLRPYFFNERLGAIDIIFLLTVAAIHLITIPKLFNYFKCNFFDHFKYIGVFLLTLIILAMGFTHNIASYRIRYILHSDISIPLSYFPFLFVLLLIVITLLSIVINDLNKKLSNSKLFIDIAFSLLLVIAMILPYTLPSSGKLIMSIYYWILYFSFYGPSIYAGVMRHNFLYINTGSYAIALGIFIRFLDIATSYVFSGFIFISCGIVLLLVSCFAEKFRKYIINIVKEQNAH